MPQPRWLPWSLGRTQLTLLASLLILLFAAIAFANLAITKNGELAIQHREQSRLDDQVKQQQRLQADLDRAQRGESLPGDAADQFGMQQKGSTLIMPAPTSVVSPREGRRFAGPPYWGDWWERLTQP